MIPVYDSVAFRAYLDSLKVGRTYRKVQYFTRLHELITIDALIQNITPGNDEEIVALSTGDVIPLNQLISVGGRFAPAYAGYELYCETCDC